MLLMLSNYWNFRLTNNQTKWVKNIEKFNSTNCQSKAFVCIDYMLSAFRDGAMNLQTQSKLIWDEKRENFYTKNLRLVDCVWEFLTKNWDDAFEEWSAEKQIKEMKSQWNTHTIANATAYKCELNDFYDDIKFFHTDANLFDLKFEYTFWFDAHSFHMDKCKNKFWYHIIICDSFWLNWLIYFTQCAKIINWLRNAFHHKINIEIKKKKK